MKLRVKGSCSLNCDMLLPYLLQQQQPMNSTAAADKITY
jgi:hypothetical protein